MAVVKPYRSRIVNSERYVVAKGLQTRDSPAFRQAIVVLEAAHRGSTDAATYETLVPIATLEADAGEIRIV